MTGGRGILLTTGHVLLEQSHSLSVLLEQSQCGAKAASQMRLRKKEEQANVTQVLLPSRISNIYTTILVKVIEASLICIAKFELE